GSMTGGRATFGNSVHNGITIALKEINGAGGINGRPVRVEPEDDQSKPEEAATAVSKLISQDKVVAIIGEVASSASLAAAPICQQNKVPMISPSSTNPKVTEVGDYIFRVCFIDPYQGEALARFAFDDLKARKVAILSDVRNEYSVGLAEFFTKTFTELGGRIVGNQSYSEGDSDFRAQLTTIKATSPDVLFIPGYYTEIGQIAIQARDLGLKQPMLGGDGWESPKLLEIGGAALEGCFYSNHYFADDPNPAVQSFVTKYRDQFGDKPDSVAALGYDAMKILAEAMKRAGAIDGPSIRDEIAKTANYQGATGTITIGPDRNAVKPLVIIEIKNGQAAYRTSVAPPGGEASAAK
ncbi:MAG TPA: ABC transporter substrate-binding protein, partial [Thermoanaerobaculia bacterium]